MERQALDRHLERTGQGHLIGASEHEHEHDIYGSHTSDDHGHGYDHDFGFDQDHNQNHRGRAHGDDDYRIRGARGGGYDPDFDHNTAYDTPLSGESVLETGSQSRMGTQ